MVLAAAFLAITFALISPTFAQISAPGSGAGSSGFGALGELLKLLLEEANNPKWQSNSENVAKLSKEVDSLIESAPSGSGVLIKTPYYKDTVNPDYHRPAAIEIVGVGPDPVSVLRDYHLKDRGQFRAFPRGTHVYDKERSRLDWVTKKNGKLIFRRQTLPHHLEKNVVKLVQHEITRRREAQKKLLDRRSDEAKSEAARQARIAKRAAKAQAQENLRQWAQRGLTGTGLEVGECCSASGQQHTGGGPGYGGLEGDGQITGISINPNTGNWYDSSRRSGTIILMTPEEAERTWRE